MMEIAVFKLRNVVNRCFYPDSSACAIVKVGESRSSWERAFIFLWEPVLNGFSKGKAGIRINGPQVSIHGRTSDDYEGFARTFLGVALYLHHKKDSIVKLSHGKEIDIAKIYKEGIVNGINPNHPEYWGKINSNQRLVENASVAIGLLLTKHHILSNFSSEQKQNLANWFKLNLRGVFLFNNKLWFKVFHHLLLKELNSEYDQSGLEQTLNCLESLYKGRGWYSDGIFESECRYDYYVAWVFHFYSLLFIYLVGDIYKKWKKKYLERAIRFLHDYQYYITPKNSQLFYGRSQLYRFASLAPIGILLLHNSYDINYSWIKRSAIDAINTFLERGAVKDDGILSMGYYGKFIPLLESYSGPASPYWAFKGFSFLLLPEGHDFWKVQTEEIKPKKIVHSIPLVRQILIHNGNSQIIMLNAGSSCIKNPIKYNKFAYSNIFLPNFDKKSPDNILLLKTARSYRWHQRGVINESSCQENVCQIKWKPDKLEGVVANTTLIPKTNGYIIIHKIDCVRPLLFKEGGFVLAESNKDIIKKIKNHKVVLQGKQGEVGIKIIQGDAKPCVYEGADNNPVKKFSFVPYFHGRLNKDQNILKFDVWARTR